MLIFDKKFFFVFCFSVFSLQNVHGITSPNSNKQEKECNQAEYYTIVDLYQAITNYNLPLIKKILGMYPAYINRVTHWQDPKAFFENNTKPAARHHHICIPILCAGRLPTKCIGLPGETRDV